MSLIVEVPNSMASWFFMMYGFGGLLWLFPHSHSWGLRSSGTAIMSIILLRVSPNAVPMDRALKKLWGPQGQKATSSNLDMEESSTSMMWVLEYGVIVVIDVNAMINRQCCS